MYIPKMGPSVQEMIESNDSFNAYMHIFYQFFQVGLGFDVIRVVNNSEYPIVTVWLFIGFGFVCFAIGNAS